MRQAAQEFVAPVMMHDGLGDHGAQPRHALAEPGGNAAAMQRQIGAAGPSSQETSRGESVKREMRFPLRSRKTGR